MELGSFGIKEDVRAVTTLLHAGICLPGRPARALLSRDAGCSGHEDSCSVAVVRPLHITAHQRCPPPTLYSPVWYVQASADTGHPQVRVSS